MATGIDSLVASLAPAGAAGPAPTQPPLDGALPGQLPALEEGAGPVPPDMMGAPDPMSAGMQPAGGNPYPTTDPDFMSEVFGQLMQMRDADHQKMESDQDAAMQASPMFQNLVAGSPMGPGAGQDGQALGMGNEMPMPGM